MKTTSWMMAAMAAGASALPQAPAPSANCDPFATSQGPKYLINNNEWGKAGSKGQQCITVTKNDDTGVEWTTKWNWSGGDGSIMSYVNAAASTIQKNLVSKVKSIPTNANWNYDNHVMWANVAYDIFTHTDPNHAVTSGDYEIMVWLNHIGITPRGKVIAPNVEVAGYHWDLWLGNDDQLKQATYTFVHTGDPDKDMDHVQMDLKAFFDNLVSAQNYPADKQHILALQFGSEIWKSNGDTTFNAQWTGDVQYNA